MSTIIIASLEPGEGRTATTAGIGACLAEEGRTVRLSRLGAAEGTDPAAEADAQVLSAVPGCTSTGAVIGEQEAQAGDADASGAIHLVEAPAGLPKDLATRLSARVVLVTAQADDGRVAELAAAAGTLGEALLGVVVTRQPERSVEAARTAISERGLTCLAALPEDRLLAGPTIREMAEALQASPLVEAGNEDEAVEHTMVGTISADPGQSYFLEHESKAVVNRFDRMDLHLGALATEPDCLILTGGGQPTPYLLDRVQGSDHAVTVLVSPDDTVRTVEVLDELYGSARFSGQRKLTRAAELFRQHLDLPALTSALQ
jgi:BioD-like phosphotransacetylase family protein